jgi:hypothetical protein
MGYFYIENHGWVHATIMLSSHSQKQNGIELVDIVFK